MNNDSRNGGRDSPAEGSDSGHSVLLVGGLLTGSTSSDHVGLQQSTLQQQVVVLDGLVGGSQNLLGDLDAGLEGVGTIRQDLRLDDGDQTVVLADSTIAGQTGGVLLDGDVRGETVLLADLQNSPPLGETSTSFVVLLAASGEVIPPLCVGLTLGTSDGLDTLMEMKNEIRGVGELGERGRVGKGISITGFFFFLLD